MGPATARAAGAEPREARLPAAARRLAGAPPDACAPSSARPGGEQPGPRFAARCPVGAPKCQRVYIVNLAQLWPRAPTVGAEPSPDRGRASAPPPYTHSWSNSDFLSQASGQRPKRIGLGPYLAPEGERHVPGALCAPPAVLHRALRGPEQSSATAPCSASGSGARQGLSWVAWGRASPSGELGRGGSRTSSARKPGAGAEQPRTPSWSCVRDPSSHCELQGRTLGACFRTHRGSNGLLSVCRPRPPPPGATS